MKYYFYNPAPPHEFAKFVSAPDGYVPAESDWTEVPPGPAVPGKTYAWDGEAWQLLDNHKGLVGWLDGVPYQITDYGPLPEGFTTDPPPPSQESVNAARKAELLGLLADLDERSIRPVRELELDPDSAYAKAKLRGIEEQAAGLRAELAALEA